MSDDDNDLRRYLPSRDRAQELCDEDAARARIARAIESEGVAAAKQPSERPPPVPASVGPRRDPPSPPAEPRAPSRDPAPMSVEPRPTQRSRRPMSSVLVSVLAILGVLAPVTLAFLLWPRPQPNDASQGTHDAAMSAVTTAGTVSLTTLPSATARATTTATWLPDSPDAASTPLKPDAVSPTPSMATSAPPGSDPPRTGPTNSVKPPAKGSAGAPEPALTGTPSAPPPEPAGTAPRYGDPDF